MPATVALIAGIGASTPALRRLAADVDAVVRRAPEPGAAAAVVLPAASLHHEVAGRRRAAFLGRAEPLGVDAAAGLISCESIASYPPGVPARLPGEHITPETGAYPRELAATGA